MEMQIHLSPVHFQVQVTAYQENQEHSILSMKSLFL